MERLRLPALLTRSVQARILASFLIVVIVVQSIGFVLINRAGTMAAQKTVGAEVATGTRVFDRLLEQDTERLIQGARLLTADYAFREAIATGDRDTVASVLANHGGRIGATLMMLVGLDHRVMADTLGSDGSAGELFPFRELLQDPGGQRAPTMVMIRGSLYQLVVVPVLAPLPMAWLAVGFRVDDALARELQRLTHLQVSFLARDGGSSWQVHASTLGSSDRERLLAEMRDASGSEANGYSMTSDEAVTRVLELARRGDHAVVAVLEEPLSEALEPFHRLQRQLTLISLFGILVSVIASFAIARGIGRPVRDLAAAARHIASGSYSRLPHQARSDEIGELASAFHAMQEGIAVRESRITDLAYRDTLTGLPNRVRFAERLDAALQRATIEAMPVAVLLMDLDHFKYVNDTLGHPIGDLLLREVATRLAAVVRHDSDTVARLGGDEFAILLPGASRDDARRAGESILRVLEAPMSLEGHVVDIRPSIGVAACPEHGHEASSLMRRADVAMYEAKRSNRGVVAWDDRYDQHSLDRLSLMADLRKAIERGQLCLVYQPKVSLRAPAECHVEALVRWQHPTRGLVPPAEFIPFAEQTGYIRVITQWVVARAVAQCAAWRRDGLPMHVSINLSARDLIDEDLPDRIAALLAGERCDPPWLSFEITESAILEDRARAVGNLERLRALGCTLAIDDYGTGYASLAYLRSLPVQELKIDKSFVMRLASDASDEIIVRSTIELAHNMGLVVVAEGVEDEAAVSRLRTLGCDMMQGYWLSRPLAEDQVEPWMRASAFVRSAERPQLRRAG
jgi:diguanylate cyclase (GGDEF)-like protein